MLNRHSISSRTLLLALLGLAVLGAGGLLIPGWIADDSGFVAEARQPATAAAPVAPAPPPVVLPPPVAQVLQSGVLIVVSKASQKMHVFKDGKLWKVTTVSTGRKGHPTPSGVFPVLQKAVFHRSNIYSGAPMPYMQRLTWSGIAIHSGYVPGYPASHGCIRVPADFARALYTLTQASATTVVVTSLPVRSDEQAKALALAMPPPLPPAVPGTTPPPLLAAATPAQAPRIEAEPLFPQVQTTGQTIQLVAANSSAEADAHWARLVSVNPELARLQKVVIPAVVGARRVYRLRASSADAFRVCAGLKSKGIDCFNVS